MKTMIFDIERASYVDGPGIRTTVFFKGCNLRCAWCHNPESQAANPQMLLYRDKCIGCGKCKEVCQQEECILCGECALFCPADARKICGKLYTPDELLSEIMKDKAYYDASGGGVTFSGGECMLQADFLVEILRKCKENGMHTAVDTAGHVPYASFEKVLPYTDLFLYDIKCMDPDTHKRYVGVDNALLLHNLERLCKDGAQVYIRIPVIVGVNDSMEEMRAIKAFLDRCGTIKKVELLPYHEMGENKYNAIGKAIPRFSAPTQEALATFRKIFE